MMMIRTALFSRRVISSLLVINFGLLSLIAPAYAQNQTAETVRSGEAISLTAVADPAADKMSARSFAELKSVAGGNQYSKAIKTAAGSTYYFLNVEFRTAASRQAAFTDLKASRLAGAHVLTAFDRFAGVFVDRDSAWNALRDNPNVVRVEFGTRVEAPPPPVVKPSALISQAIPEEIVRGGYKGLTGKNVIIAVLDTGIDFRHPDFINYSSTGLPTSRIAYLWDTATEFRQGRGSIAPFRFPNGTSIGTLYTQEHLTRELRSSSFNIPATDMDGHGTACASVAAGNGNADKQTNGLKRKDVIGVAPDAEIIGVRLGQDGLENDYLINAIAEWITNVAGKKPFVISGSFGSHFSGHDGQLVWERELASRFPQTAPGRALVFAAGNEGNDAIHAKVNFTADDKVVSWVAEEETIIKMYFDSADPKITISGTKATPIQAVQPSPLSVEINPITKQLEGRLKVNKGLGAIWLENLSGIPVEAHLYFMSQKRGSFSPENAVASHLVGSPGAMENAITVGSFDFNDNFHSGGATTNLSSVCKDSNGVTVPFQIGWLSCYSSPGPARNGVAKPDIVAPGEWYSSANAKDQGKHAGDWAEPDSTGYYRAMNGTSAATPYVAGIVALMFEKKPTLTTAEIKTLLNNTATKADLRPFSGRIPHKFWGNGKLSRLAVDGIFAGFCGCELHASENWGFGSYGTTAFVTKGHPRKVS